MNYYNAIHKLSIGEKIPRKEKKKIIGNKISSSELKRKLKTVVPDEFGDYCYEDGFCPKCGCDFYYGSGNEEYYPEHFERFYCLRCHFFVGVIDNSPFVHCFSAKEYGYDLNKI